MGRIIVKEAEELLDKEFKVHQHGFVRLVDYMGGDAAIVQAARVSYGKGTKKISEDRGLIRRLMRDKHTSPLEMVEFKFHVKLPIFVARQWIRHRTANVNEYSGRYSVMKNEFYVPAEEDIRLQSTDNKQGRSDDVIHPDVAKVIQNSMKITATEAFKEYNILIDADISREIARINLPLSTYTEWYWKIDLHNLLHFLRLRMDKHAQKEFRDYAEIIAMMVKKTCPIVWEAFEDYVLNAMTLSGPEVEALQLMLANTDFVIPTVGDVAHLRISATEGKEFGDKIKRLKE